MIRRSLENTPIWFQYDAYQFANGVIFASASMRDRFSQSSGVQFFHPSQVGWATAPVFITFDVAGTANGGFFKLFLDRDTLVVTIEYTDLDLTGGGATWTMQPTSCIVNRY